MSSSEFSPIVTVRTGLSYVTALDGTIVAVGDPAWRRFAEENGAPGLTAEAVVGRSLFDLIHGETVRAAYRRIYDRLASGSRSEVAFDYHCDAPATSRVMRMSMTPIVRRQGVAAILHHSRILAERSRAPIPLFAFASARAPGTDEPLVRLCSWCQRIEWPPSAPPGASVAWITAEDYAAKDAPQDRAVTHVICPTCKEAWMCD